MINVRKNIKKKLLSLKVFVNKTKFTKNTSIIATQLM